MMRAGIKRFPTLFAALIGLLGGGLITIVPLAFGQGTNRGSALLICDGTSLSCSSVADTEVFTRVSGTIDGIARSTWLQMAGISGGQSATCGTGSGDDCTFTSTSHATPGNFDFNTTSAGTNDILEGQRLIRKTTGTASAGIGYALPFYVSNGVAGGATTKVAGVLRSSLSTVTNTAEVGRFALSIMGTPAGTVPAAASEQHVWTSTDYALTATTTAESTATDVSTLTSLTTGLAAAGQGLCEVKRGEDGAGNTQEIGRMCSTLTTVTNGAEVGKVEMLLVSAGTVPGAGSGQHAWTPGQYQGPNGTVALPAMSFASDTDTGIYRIGANDFGFVSNGAAVAHVSATDFNVMTGTSFTLSDGVDVVLGTSSGTRFGNSAGAKVGFHGSTAVAQQASTTDLRTLLINYGFLATGGASPLNLNGGALTAGTTAINGELTMGAAVFLNTGVATGLTASTTQTQAAGTAITAQLTVFSTVTNASDAATLGGAIAGRCIRVVNNGAQTLQIFPAVGDNFSGSAADASTTLATTKNREYCAYDTATWVLSAIGPS